MSLGPMLIYIYRKTPKSSDPETFTVIIIKFDQDGFTVKHPKNADGLANSVDPDQTAPLETVWSGSALFAQSYLSQNLGSLR